MALPVNEKALLFGETGSLVGVVTDPPPQTRGDDRPGVVILNAGALHRVGPNRLHVQLARTLAEAGFVALRFDLSGIGDSRRSEAGSESHREAAVRETREALDLLATTRGLTRFLLFGICSGADNSILTALDDSRVVGATLIDGHNIAGAGYTLFCYRKRFFDLRGWARLLSARSEVWGLTRDRLTRWRSPEAPAAGGQLALPTLAHHTRQLRALVDREVHLLLAYTGDSPAYYNYWRALARRIRSWPERSRVSVEYFEDSDHVFTAVCNQRRLIQRVLEWATALPRDASVPQRTSHRP